MPIKLHWTPLRDATLKHLRQQAHGWDSIAATLSISRNAVMERARKLGARLPSRLAALADAVEDPDRPSLPAGHAITWSVLTDHTALAGTPYPGLPPMGSRRSGGCGIC